ncbi:laminin subunit alpha-5-like [Sinocyclocheilus grahami]|uniref:laminin subunit alpha-5-like n=1 Tax=Sinocyclocheilus grahami TaxID=75366 RepID=UPI0007AD1904|nr:PREDICTED: laminin subunit alpha-5-like [Sinocyclocheilus grahami]
MARGPVLVFLSLLLTQALTAQGLPINGVNGFSLHPPYFNLAEGTKITATATCGVDESQQPIQDLYCKLVGGPVSGDPSQTIQGQYCDICTSEDTNKAHPINNAIDGTERWWQSPPLSRSAKYNEVNVTLDLGQLFHVAYVLIKFANSPRPDLWVLERSIDFGKTYQPWQFFASSKRDCIERFGQRTIERINHDDDIICTTEYSRIVPLENGEIVVSLVNGRPGAMNFSYSPILREFTKATNIRLRFLHTNTLLGHLMGKALRDPTVTRRYYYSIKDVSIGGRCVCNGHAEACNAQDPNDPYKLQCDCRHNTCGPSCDHCCTGFNQFPWKPATTYSANECEPCNCHRHSSECYYDPEIDQRRASLNMQGEYDGGGVCVECQHHTTGINCERCIPGYYRSPDHSLESPFACSECQCESKFTDGTCEDLTGRCYCKPNYTGENCDTCAEGYEGFPECYQRYISGEARPAGEIINCECSAAGTEGNSCRPDPHTNTCVCKPEFTGEHCDTCAPGHFGLNCQRCQCSGQGCLDGSCDALTSQCVCRSGFQGYSCEQCAPGYFNYPLCQYCGCSVVGSMPEICNTAGQCLCRPEFTGPRCDQCRSGFHSYPNCQVCTCDPRTSLDSSCTLSGQCNCRPNYSGPKCDQCAPGYYSYPSCTPCRCSLEGSRFSSCDPVSGQCVCLPNIVGQRCDSCSPGSYGFPLCQVGTCNPAGSVHNDILPTVGSCNCRPHVEGVACDRCKPLYWNLSLHTVYGCSSCDCNTLGTMSEVAECTQSTGQCYCKPNVCSGTCNVCKDGYFSLQKNNYFGCQGCQCDIGGSVGQACNERHGRCRCRPNVEGPKCNQPRSDHYFPDLHHMKSEVEEGTTMDGRPVRFGYNPLEFESFSWRGYAQMSPIQPRVLVEVVVGSPDLFHVVLHYVNRGGVDVRGRVSVIEDGRHFLCGNCSEQSKQIVFAPTSEPTFVSVPQNSFVEPFVLNPGTWTVIIEAEGILLDYLVLLPSAYYEAPILQLQVTEPCSYSNTQDSSQNCLQYMYLSLDEFPSISSNDANCRSDNHLPRPCHIEKITPRHPSMAICSGNDMNVQLRGRVPVPGEYVLVVEYASEDQFPQTFNVSINSPGESTHQEQIILLHCKYSFLCRAVSVDDKKRVAVFTLSTEADILLTTDRSSFFLHKVFLIPRAQFTMEYLKPRVHCINTHGHFSPDSFRFAPFTLKRNPVFVCFLSQNAVIYSTLVHALGRYVFILHYHQPLHPTYNVQVHINGGRIWQGHVNASFCPHGYGCRSVVMSESQIILDVTDYEIILTLRVPDRKTLWLDYVLVVPESTYSSSFLSEEPLDKSYDFISNCGQNSFYINPSTASPFCRNSAVSLSAFFNNGAVPCGCHEVGAESDTCDTFGGQCKCRPNVIGRDCSQCATGYYGFPNCRPCNCGTRLCEPVTGECICPPRTLQPDCVTCEPQTFGCHPLVGCELCNCSRPGVASLEIGCDTHNGQCRCRNNIVGRQCDRCTPGFYGYPNCRPCDCSEAGTEKDVCDSITGRCLCKENVEGSRCDQCKLGTFHLDPTNAKGCTKCFCFGATDRCHSSVKRRSEIMDMAGWVLLRSDRQEVPVSTYLDQDLVEADLSDVPDVSQDLHWHAPRAYLGDKVSSYGGYLRYRLHTQTMRGDAFLIVETTRPDVILKGNQMTLVYMEREYSSPEDPHEGIVHLVEESFRHAQTGNSVSREELMMVLVALESLQIRALHSQSAQSVSLRAAVLEGADNLPSGRHANNVEICLCPGHYLGDSCQKCAPGYYRDTKGLFLGKCVPCNCNGHSDECLHGSGVCVNCRHNTAGNHCEQCLGGFHGNNTVDGHAVSCSSCPCPLQVASNNFAIRCVEKPNHMQCLCRPGYAGSKCERCAPGHYGNPMVIGSTCQPCNCNGNSDPNMLFSDCHPLTGDCQSCMHNSAGPHCEICAPGFYGDAITAKNCTRCNCSPCGTERCDPHTGQCHCKPGVVGAHCDLCEHGAFGFDTCSGCRKCDCDAAAALVQPCDPVKGTCACQPGVNGPNCRQCAPGYWGYSPNGCKKCECRGGRCDPRTGECHCAAGLTGKQCDTCLNKYSVPVLHGADVHCQLVDRVKNEIANQTLNNEAVAENIRNKLNQFNQQLMDLRDAMNEAVKNTANAVEANNIHEKRMEELQNTVNNLLKKQKEVENQLQMADDDVTQVNDLLSMLQDSKEDYERLAAQLDGARQPLAEKVQKYAPSANKIPLVEAAEKHAEMLDQLANNLSSLISGSNRDGFIQRALNASGAYTDIINSVLEAETAAKKASEAATEALENIKDKDLPLQAATLKNQSNELVKEAEELNNSSQSLKPRVDSIQKSLQDGEKKKEKMLQDLKNIQNSLNASREDIAKDIAAAKSAVEQANNTVTNVSNALAPIQKQLEEWQKQYGDSNATSDDINKALNDANTSVAALSDTLPQLMKKLDRLQSTSFQPSNISDSIQRIRQLIEQARNAANKVSVSMQFNGNSGVQVRTPSNVADLAAYSSLHMYIKLPRATRTLRQTDTTKPQFVLYFGNKDSKKDYMAMTLEGSKLRWYFNVGEDTAQVIMTEDVNKDYFNKIVLERTLQYGQMAMSTDSEETKIVKQSMEAREGKGLLNLPAEETVFYVGSYPSTFTPPVDLNMTSPNFFKGCLELLSLNEELISLYNFGQTFQMNTTTDLPCSRRRPANTPEWGVDGVYFDGSGYVEVLFETLKDDRVFEQHVKLISQNGILLLFQRQDKYVCIAVQGGLLKVLHNLDGQVSNLTDPQQDSKIKISNAQAKFLDVIFQLSKNEMLVRLDRQKVYTLSSKELSFTGRYFLGGVPDDQMPESLKSVFGKRGSIKGCLRTIKAMRSFVQMKTMKSAGISYGCPDDLLFTREAHFTGEGYLGLKMDDVLNPDSFYAGIGFRTDQQTGLMFYRQGQSDRCQVVLDRGHVVVSTEKNGVRSQKTYNDDNSHYVAFYRIRDGLLVYIDDVLEKQGVNVSAADSRTALQSDLSYVGGTPESDGLTNLTGCVSNFFMKRNNEPQTVEDMKKAQEGHEYTFVCPSSSVPLEILDSPRRMNPKNKPHGSRMARGSCQGEMSIQEVDAHHFSGSSHSHLRFDSLPQAFSKAPHISVGVRVNSSSGLIFHVAEGKGQRTMTLSVFDGHLMLTVNGGKRKTSIRSKNKYSDGLWHTVFVRVEADRASLTVDGIHTQNKRVTGGGKTAFGAPLYIGGLPSDHSAAMAGFVGCVRDLNLNEVLSQSPSHSVGVTPCYQQPLQPGVYFSSQGGYLTIDESLVLARDLEIQLEVRLVSDSGLLLHAGAKKTRQLSLFLNQGQVTVLVNSGSGEFSVSLTPEESLCDGGWHTVAVVKKSNVIQLHVDAASEHGVGPKPSRSNGGKETVYLGGVPDTIAVPGLPSTVLSFHGCVRKAILNHRPVMLSKPLSVSGSVGTQGCPAL